VKIPDYISPIIGYRVWKWEPAGLKSLNGEPWLPQRRLAATCRAADCGAFVGRAENAHDDHEPPQPDCTCGIYASKSHEHLRSAGYEGYGIHGEVHLWGTVVEHELGWRAQYAYPKSLVLPLEMIPLGVETLESSLQSLVTTAATSSFSAKREECRCGSDVPATTRMGSTYSSKNVKAGMPSGHGNGGSSAATVWRSSVGASPRLSTLTANGFKPCCGTKAR
jgi:hypothetical protein